MCELKPSDQEHLSKISKAEFVSQPPHDNEQDDVSRELQIVELSAGSLVEDAMAAFATKTTVT
jgi:phosphate uptake regulator